MTVLTDTQAVKLSYAAGFRVGLGLAEIAAIAHAESGLDSTATNTEGNTPPSTDRGILMLNSFYHKEISDNCAFNPACAFKAGFAISGHGQTFSEWSTYEEGKHKPFLPQVRAAIAALGAPYSTPINAPKLAYPFSGTYPLTQKYGITDFSGEPPGYLYPDGSLDYFTNNGTAVRYPHLHAGLDFGCPTGTPILAVADGVVSFAGQDQTGFGNAIKVAHSALGLTSLYGHLQSFTVKQGQAVKAGQQIALSNNTGNSDGAHIHLSLIRNSDGHYVDPSPYLSTTPVKPPLPPKPANAYHEQAFTGQTMVGRTRLFLGPSTALPVLGELNPGQTISFVGWSFGEPHFDMSVKAWDRRWFVTVSPKTNGSGWVQSARIQGNPSGSAP